jgi:hypothetical protein
LTIRAAASLAFPSWFMWDERRFREMGFARHYPCSLTVSNR